MNVTWSLGSSVGEGREGMSLVNASRGKKERLSLLAVKFTSRQQGNTTLQLLRFPLMMNHFESFLGTTLCMIKISNGAC